MESLPNENGGCKVYRRKRKIPSSSEGSNPEEAIPMNTKNTKGKAKSHIPPCVVVQGNECNELVELDKRTEKEASNSDAHVGSSMAPQAQNEVKHDKLLILRDVLEKPIHEDLPESTLPCDKDDIEESGRIQRVYTAYGQEHKEKYVRLRARQKQRLALRNKGKRTLPISLRILGPRQDSNHHIVKENNGATAESLRILKGKNVAIPNSSSDKMNGSSSHGKTMVQSASTWRPSGYLKIKTKDNTNGVEWNGMELDALWIGVRRYGHAKWEKILGDPHLRKYFNKKKTPYDLYTKWKTHHQNISSSSPKPPKNGVITHSSAVPLSPSLMAAARNNNNPNNAISIRNRIGANSPHSSSSSSAAAGPALNNNNMNMMNSNGDENNRDRLMRLQMNIVKNALRNLRSGPVQNAAARGVTRERNNMPLNIDLNFPPPDEEEEQDTDSETTLSC